MSSCCGPWLPSSVCVMMRVPVATAALAAARAHFYSFAVIGELVATLITPARMPVPAMPSLISRT